MEAPTFPERIYRVAQIVTNPGSTLLYSIDAVKLVLWSPKLYLEYGRCVTQFITQRAGKLDLAVFRSG
jgi:hypothetical protein